MTDQNRSYSLKVCVLASGSSGNCIYVSDGSTSLLIDAGLSARELSKRMRARAIEPSGIDAILVSHEHSDHISGVGPFSRRYGLPVYISPGTEKAALKQLGRIREVIPFDSGKPFRIHGMEIHPFSTSHDAEDPSGFTITCNAEKIGIVTDLGTASGPVQEHLKGCGLLVLESNHDPDMLTEGPYPWPLKQRIRSITGHLSNEASARLLCEVNHDGLKHVILAHLSEVNNKPSLALAAARGAIPDCATQIAAAGRDGLSEACLL